MLAINQTEIDNKFLVITYITTIMITKKLFSLLICTVLSVGCSNLKTDKDFDLSLVKDTDNGRSKFNVNLKTATYFLSKLEFSGKANHDIKNITPIISGKDTLLYIANYANRGGWVVLSGDKRVSPILASSETGEIDTNNIGEAAIWFEDVVSSILQIKRNSNNQDTISDNFKTWRKMEMLAMGIRKTRDRDEDKDVLRSQKKPRIVYVGEFEDILIDTKVRVLSDKAVGPLIKTKWGQTNGFDQCVPLCYETNEPCPAGCVSVAGGQMLYFFHYLKNKPQEFYSNGLCVGYPNNYRFYFSNPTSDAWDKMAVNSQEIDLEKKKYVSILLGYIGLKVQMEYSKEGSGADDKKLLDVYNEFGIKADYSKYCPELVRESLDKGIPVNISAKKNKYFNIAYIVAFPWLDSRWLYKDGHAWIIDGYKDKTIRYTYTYDRRPKLKNSEETDPEPPIEEPGGGDISEDEEIIYVPVEYGIYEHNVTFRNYFWKMNFGWGGIADEGEYKTSEDDYWQTSEEIIYKFDKKIIHNFRFD